MNITKAKKTKLDIYNDIIGIFTESITKQSESGKFPTEKDLYSLSTIIQYNVEKNKHKNAAVSNAFNEIKDRFGVVYVKNSFYKESIPYFYLLENMTAQEAIEVKNRYEAENKKAALPEIKKRLENRSISAKKKAQKTKKAK